MQHIVSLDYCPATGEVTPVTADQLADETAGYNEPPPGMCPSRPTRRHWQRLNRKFRDQGLPPDTAWYRACRAVTAL